MSLIPPWVPEMVMVDVDGTLTDRRRGLMPEVIPALRMIEAKGIPIGLATGNVRPIGWGLARMLGISGPLVVENGGVVWDPVTGRLQRLGDGEKGRQAALWLAERIEGLDPKGIESNAWRESEWCLKPDEDIESIRKAHSNSPHSELEIVRTGFAIHLAEPGLDKRAGVRVAAKWRGVNTARICAIGDAPNDIPLFKEVGWSMAVGGSFGDVEGYASVVAEKKHGYAVVEFCEQLSRSIEENEGANGFTEH